MSWLRALDRRADDAKSNARYIDFVCNILYRPPPPHLPLAIHTIPLS